VSHAKIFAMKKDKSTVKHRKEAADQYKHGYQLIPVKKMSINEAAALLCSAGIEVNEEEAEQIMEFLYILTQITLKEFFSPD
jgi:hypothetical protein